MNLRDSPGPNAHGTKAQIHTPHIVEATSQQASSPRARAPGQQSPWSGRSLGRGLQEALRSRTSPNITFPARTRHPGPFLLLRVIFLPGPWVPATQGTSAWRFISLLLPVTICKGGPEFLGSAAEEARAQRHCLLAQGNTTGKAKQARVGATQSGVGVPLPT